MAMSRADAVRVMRVGRRLNELAQELHGLEEEMAEVLGAHVPGPDDAEWWRAFMADVEAGEEVA